MSDPLQSLRSYRAPLWARALGWWRARQARTAADKQWRLVAVVRQWTWWTDYERWDHQAYFCYQRGGQRKYEHRATSILLERKELSSKVYLYAVKVWVDGGLSEARLCEWANQNHNQPTKIPS